jgi:hypothetical protein
LNLSANHNPDRHAIQLSDKTRNRVRLFFLCLAWSAFPAISQGQDADTVAIALSLKTGGSLQGRVIDHDVTGLVLVSQGKPFVFAWEEVEAGSAYHALRSLKEHARPDETQLTATDHVDLAMFAIARGRGDIAHNEFTRACRKDPDLNERMRLEMDAFRAARKTRDARFGKPGPSEETGDPINEATAPLQGFSLISSDQKTGYHYGGLAGEEYVDEIMKVYNGFGDSVRQHVYRDLERVETEHFLIFTDFPRPIRDELGPQCEAMFEALRRRFGIPRGERVFLAKCPVFCWWNRARFDRFALLYDGYQGTNTIGYTRSNPETGHVHLSLLLQGRSRDDLERFAGTLVHEGTHAFLHRLYSTRLIPHWVNEGLAELVAEEVLGDAYFAAEKADLLERQFVRREWPIMSMLVRGGPIDIPEYPLAHSVIRYLERLGAGKLARFIKALKDGQDIPGALATAYEGLTLSDLDKAWRSDITRRQPREHSELPWHRD